MATAVKKRGNFVSFFLAIFFTILISIPAYSTEPEQSTEAPAPVEQDASPTAPEASAPESTAPPPEVGADGGQVISVPAIGNSPLCTP